MGIYIISAQIAHFVYVLFKKATVPESAIKQEMEIIAIVNFPFAERNGELSHISIYTKESTNNLNIASSRNSSKKFELYGVFQEARQIIASSDKSSPVREKHLIAAIPEAHTVQLYHLSWGTVGHIHRGFFITPGHNVCSDHLQEIGMLFICMTYYAFYWERQGTYQDNTDRWQSNLNSTR